jgi:hypothetical protein
MQATEERRRLQEAKQREEVQRERDLQDRQAKSYGEVVREIFARGLTINALAGLVLDSLERLRSNPELETEWAARGAEYFRPAGAQRKRPAGTNGATGNGHDRHGQAPTGQSPAGAPALPSRARAPAAQGAADLLGGLAQDQPGQETQAEGGSDGQDP